MRPARGDVGAKLFDVAARVVRMEDVDPAVVHDLLQRVAGVLDVARVDQSTAAGAVVHPDVRRYAVGEFAKPGFALAQRLFHELAGVDVDDHRDPAAAGAAVEYRRVRRVDPAAPDAGELDFLLVSDLFAFEHPLEVRP